MNNTFVFMQMSLKMLPKPEMTAQSSVPCTLLQIETYGESGNAGYNMWQLTSHGA